MLTPTRFDQITPEAISARLRTAIHQQRADPLATIRLTPKQIEFVRAVALHDETALRAANKLGKSTVAALTMVALLRGLPVFAGVVLPRLRYPAVGWVLTRTYKQQVEGTQAAVELALGAWPHQIAWENRAEGIWSAVWIRPEGWTNDDPQSWAKLVFNSQQSSRNDADVAKGARLDVAWFDEPGYPAVVRELRKAGRPGWPFRIMHTFTPIRRSEWADLRDDIERRGSHIHEIVASIYDSREDMPGGFLTLREVAQLEQFYAGDPHRIARLQGAYCDVSGASLFEHCMDEVLRMLAQCEPGETHVVSNATRGGIEIAWPMQHLRGGLEVWGWPGEDDVGIIVADPSSGVRDPDKSDSQQPRNPAGLILGSMKQRMVVARYVGYTNAHELGIMARGLANRCARWLLVHETNGGWGETFLRAFRDSPQASTGSYWYEKNMITGKYATEPGWNQTHTRRGELIAALQRAMSEGGIEIRSRAMLENLMQVRLNQNERWDQGDGRGPHAEDMITSGIFAAVLERGTAIRAGQPVKLAPASTRAAPARLPLPLA